MPMTRRYRSLLLVLVVGTSSPLFAASVFTSRPDDPAAVYLTSPEFAVRADGLTDDTAAVQAAVDKAATTPEGGILFVPSGRYRLTRTVYVWRGVRLIGYGATRPAFVLGDDTPGYQQGIGLMVMFTHASPGSPSRPPGSAKVPFPPPGRCTAHHHCRSRICRVAAQPADFLAG